MIALVVLLILSDTSLVIETDGQTRLVFLAASNSAGFQQSQAACCGRVAPARKRLCWWVATAPISLLQLHIHSLPYVSRGHEKLKVGFSRRQVKTKRYKRALGELRHITGNGSFCEKHSYSGKRVPYTPARNFSLTRLVL